jgi:3-hydroxyisobutyrate dehydrogenase-like beta-hydroxyacid dehydrogenase
MKNPNIPKIAVIGFGEAGSSLCQGWGLNDVRAFDIKQHGDAGLAAEKVAQMMAAGVIIGDDVASIVSDTDMIFSTVTADQAHAAASAVAKTIQPGAYYLDLNSCAPSTKQKNAALIKEAGGLYVDVAVMATITSKYHQTAMLVAGEHAKPAIALMLALDMKPVHVQGPVGRASTIKMIRSIMMKGIEALTAECFIAACKAGVTDEVAASLNASQTSEGWKVQAAYNMERMTTHGLRRAAEMREVAITLADLDIAGDMTAGAINWQEQLGNLGLSLLETEGLEPRIDAIREALEAKYQP